MSILSTRIFAVIMMVTSLFYLAGSADKSALTMSLTAVLGSRELFIYYTVAMLLSSVLLLRYPLKRLPLIVFSVFWIALARLSILGISHTAFLYYSSFFAITLYNIYSPLVQFKRLTSRKMAIPFFIGMICILLPIVNEVSGQGLDIFFDTLDFIFLGQINPVIFYILYHVICLIGLIHSEFIPNSNTKRFMTQLLFSPFIFHGANFTIVIFFFFPQSIYAIPLLMGEPIMWVLSSLEYPYGE